MIEQDFCTIGHSHYAGGSAKVKLTKNQKPREDNMGNAKTETLKSSLRGNLIQKLTMWGTRRHVSFTMA
jgi:hypothetical protein